MTPPLAHRVDAILRPDPGRVVARLYLAGEELPRGDSRTGAVVARVLALPESVVERAARQLQSDFSSRHRDFSALIADNAAMVSSHLDKAAAPMSAARALVLGASFTAEYSVEGAALCNPSATPHPDQSGLDAGQLRVAVSVRCIGEGHISSIGFATAVIGPGPSWTFEPRQRPAVAGASRPTHWQAEHLRAVLADMGQIDGLAHSVLASLPATFTQAGLEKALAEAHADLLARPGAQGTVDLMRHLVSSAYEVTFPADTAISQQILLPSASDESNGLEDARLVRFVDADGAVEYRATYTAFDGVRIAPRILTSPDLRTFRAHRLAGPAARNKGMALFPRLVGGRHRSLCRSDGENNYIASSDDGLVWGSPKRIGSPDSIWEVLQVGNCGSPLETEQGWLVLTHGVGPMRSYAIGALLLDLDEPSRVVKKLERPLLQPMPSERDGYVPNVVYSCGGLVHDGRLWLPHGIDDARIGVAWADVDELIAAMTPVGDGAR